MTNAIPELVTVNDFNSLFMKSLEIDIFNSAFFIFY